MLVSEGLSANQARPVAPVEDHFEGQYKQGGLNRKQSDASKRKNHETKAKK
jgi:hypothetical protein